MDRTPTSPEPVVGNTSYRSGLEKQIGASIDHLPEVSNAKPTDVTEVAPDSHVGTAE